VVARKKETRRALAFPEGKVDFLQLVAEKTKEGLPRTRRTIASLVKGRWHFRRK